LTQYTHLFFCLPCLLVPGTDVANVLSAIWRIAKATGVMAGFNTEFTEAVSDNSDTKHRLSPYNAHYRNYNLLLGIWFSLLYEFEIQNYLKLCNLYAIEK